MQIKTYLTLLFLSCLTFNTHAKKAEFSGYPESIIKLNDYLTHHVIVAEKSTHRLFLFANNQGMPVLLKTFNMATGKKRGDKLFQGDFRTPEGVYRILSFIDKPTLLNMYGKEGEIYGAGAFVLNYPNVLDKRQGKTGGGIWLHSTNDNLRIQKGLDSRGCVVITDTDLKEVSKFIELNKTSLIIVQDLRLLPQRTWQSQKAGLESFIDKWVDAWRSKDIKEYISHYHPEKFRDPFKRDFKALRQYKKQVFWNPGTPEIELSEISILKYNHYVKVQFKQKYKSRTIDDIGLKTLYLEKDKHYNWKIVHEKWSKINEPEDTSMAQFQPSMRFFDS